MENDCRILELMFSCYRDAWKGVSKLKKDEAQKKYVSLFTKVARKINNDESREVLEKMKGG